MDSPNVNEQDQSTLLAQSLSIRSASAGLLNSLAIYTRGISNSDRQAALTTLRGSLLLIEQITERIANGKY